MIAETCCFVSHNWRFLACDCFYLLDKEDSTMLTRLSILSHEEVYRVEVYRGTVLRQRVALVMQPS